MPGSDAAGMRDVGVVCYEMYDGKKTLGVKLSWDKRYITLAPVATLLGLAFHLHDPEHLIGEVDNVGITLALVPAKFKGVKIGRRHYPARSAFMNGPTQGRNVFVPMEFLIGGVEYAGQGWRMLMECLVDRTRHLAAGDRHRVDQAIAARDVGLCAGAAAVRHSGGADGGGGRAARAHGAVAPIRTRRRAG